MSFLSRLLHGKRDPREQVRPLWHRIVEIAREPHWYAQCGASDTVTGRFDMVALVLAMVLLRMEGRDELRQPSVLLTELFVEDMDGQLREAGVGDVVVGKKVGKLMSVLGGRLGALREALAGDSNTDLADAIMRNVTLNDGADPQVMAAAVRQFSGELARIEEATLLKGEIER